MRILVLTKRQYMGRDLLDDQYGRFRELPLALVSAGHKVEGLCLSYRHRDEGRREDSSTVARVEWQSLNLTRLFRGSNGYWEAIDKMAASGPPDVVWACSDAPHAFLGVRAARRLGAKLVVDLYDNFESYGLTRLPGMRTALRRSVRGADGVTCVSQPLAQLVYDQYRYSGLTEVIENAVPADMFRPLNREYARATLDLPKDAVLIGTAGALSRSRGIQVLFTAFSWLAEERPDVHLVLAGQKDRDVTLPEGGRVHYLGLLPPDRVPLLLNALNVSVICNRESTFGSYCFPQKFYESVACGVPALSAGVGAMRTLLKEHPANLFEPEDPESLLQKLRDQITQPTPVPLAAPTWNDLAQRLAVFFNRVVERP